MIRFKDLVFEEYSIDPVTAVITDKCGNVLRQSKHRGRPIVYLNGESIAVHCIQAHTHIGYDKKLVVHHKDFTKTNNAVDNLQLMTKAEHAHVHYEYTLKGKGWYKGQPAHNKGVPMTPEQKALISEINKGLHYWNNGEINKRSKECPGDGWVRGRLIECKGENNPAFGKHWYYNVNDETDIKYCNECPGPEYVLGNPRTKKKANVA